eukprot:snap_masked-scaffold_3-processed-gene-9.38-mRNA-1 protein AED:1.00 eAED:1.00 QI:0/0/0/0/1/1/2/0/62
MEKGCVKFIIKLSFAKNTEEIVIFLRLEKCILAAIKSLGYFCGSTKHIDMQQTFLKKNKRLQ